MWNINKIATKLSVAVLTFSAMAVAQGPVGDTVLVTFDRPVQVGSQTLQPGEYRIRQITTASNPRVLEFTSDNGTKLETTVTAIPALQNTAPGQTRVILQDEGGGASLSRLWVQGKNYGYEFPGEAAVAPRPATAATISMQARYEPAPAPQEVAAAPPPPPAETPAPREETPRAEPPPPPAEPPAVIAQAQPAPEPAPPPQPSTPAVPATALGWMEVLFAGLMLTSAGLLLYWRAARSVR